MIWLGRVVVMLRGTYPCAIVHDSDPLPLPGFGLVADCRVRVFLHVCCVDCVQSLVLAANFDFVPSSVGCKTLALIWEHSTFCTFTVPSFAPISLSTFSVLFLVDEDLGEADVRLTMHVGF